jgi:predicted ATPase
VTHQDFHVITGASGAGKSTLVAALRELGHSTVPEAARAIMQANPGYDGRIIPPGERAAFMEDVLDRSIRDHAAARSMQPPVFFDRGIPDWLRFVNPDTSPRHEAASRCRYAGTVFLAEPWPEIHVNDAQRLASFERAARSFEATVSAYAEAGYDTCVIPKAPVEARVAFVLARVAAARSTVPGSGAVSPHDDIVAQGPIIPHDRAIAKAAT